MALDRIRMTMEDDRINAAIDYLETTVRDHGCEPHVVDAYVDYQVAEDARRLLEVVRADKALVRSIFR